MAGDILHECSNGSRFHRALIYLRDSASKLFWVVVMFLVCELLIWGIYTALHLAGVEFLSSIVGMVVVFLAMLLLARLAPRSEVLYGKYVKAKVCPQILASSPSLSNLCLVNRVLMRCRSTSST